MTGSNRWATAVTYAVAITFSSKILVIQVDNEGSWSKTWLNGEIYAIGSGFEITTDVSVIQMSPTQFVLRKSTNFYVNIDIRKFSIDLFVKSKSSVCISSTGLLGSCDKDQTNDFKLSDGSILQEGSLLFDLTVFNIENLFLPSWKSDDEIFTHILYGNTRGSAHTCLEIKSSPMESEPLYFFTDSELTIDITFRMESVSGICSTLWSYKNPSGHVFSALVCETYVSFLFYTDTEHKTMINTLPVRLSTWYQLSTVWTSSDKMLNFYLIEDGLSYSNAFTKGSIGLNTFSPGGTFMLGTTHYLDHSFDGLIDNLLIWKSSFSLKEILARAFTYIMDESEDELSYIWRFNDGQGFKTYDSSGHHKQFKWQIGNWADIHWKIGAYKMKYPFSLIQKRVIVSHSSDTEIKSCKVIISNIPDSKVLSDSEDYMYFTECLISKYLMPELSGLYGFVTAISERINFNRTSSGYPLKIICNQYPGLSNWYGVNCNQYCITGAGVLNSENNICICNSGYFGESCQHQCPYARGKVCGGGICDSETGQCTCSSKRYDPQSDCVTCTHGWIGKDCSSIAATIPNDLQTYSAVCFGQGYCNMFDGQAFNLRSPGEYILFQKTSSAFTIYVRMRPCAGSRTCIQQVWFHLPSDDFTIKLPLTENKPLILQHNGAKITMENLGSYHINAFASISWIDKVTLEFVLGSVTVQVSYVALSPYLSVNVETKCSHNDQTGLLGNCNHNTNDDFLDSSGRPVPYRDISDEIINNQFSVYFTRTTFVNNHFIYGYPDSSLREPESMSKGYSLFFNRSGAMTGKVPYHSFYDQKHLNVSIEAKIKCLSVSGFILGYYIPGSEKQFGLYLNNTVLEIYINQQTLITDIQLSTEKWYHVIMSFHVTNSFLNIYIYSDGSLEHTTHFEVTELFFLPSGNFFLGEWIINPPLPFIPFYGLIGELKIWNIYLDIQMAYQLANNADVNKVKGLVMNYQFTEGFGFTTFDLVLHIGMTIAEIENKVAWILSEKPGKATMSQTVLSTQEIKRIVECEKIFSIKSLRDACGGFGEDFSSFYIDACKNDNNYVPTLQAYVTICNAILRPVVNPVTDLCTDHRASHYDTFCGEFCKHGTPTYNGCECDIGFWSWNCANECPSRIGDDKLPCNSHGSCDKDSGKCLCFTNFNETNNCQHCLANFTGEYCEKAKLSLPDIPVNANTTVPIRKICQIFGSLKVKTFDNDVIAIQNSEEWYLLKPMTQGYPEIKVRTIQCRKKICLKSLQLSYLSEIIVIHGTNKRKSERIKVNGKFGTSALQNFVFRSKSENSIILKGNKGTFNDYIKLRVHFTRKGYLSLLMKIDCNNCTKNTLCEPDSLFLKAYMPNDSSSFRHITVPKANHTLPDDIDEPNTKALYDLSFKRSDVREYSHELFQSNISATGDKFTIISSNILTNIFSPNERNAIKFSLSLHEGASGGIFQYVGKSTFTMYVENGRIKVHADKSVIDTFIDIPENKWCDVKMSYDDIGQIITLLVTCHIGNGKEPVTKTSIFSVPGHCFTGNGRIVIGKPIGAFNKSLGIASDGSFSGEIDDLIVYKGKEKEPIIYFNFDEVDGDRISDSSGTVNYLKIHDPYNKGTSKITISTKPSVSIATVVKSEFSDEDSYQQARNKCTQIFSSQKIENSCSSLGETTKELFIGSCMDEVADDGYAVFSFQSYLVLCYEQIFETEDNDGNDSEQNDVIRYLCHEDFVSAGYVGKDCDVRCVHPEPTGDGLTCTCAKGYWGTSCNFECPGSAVMPCSGNGICDSHNGQCTCSMNRQGNDCSLCAKSWYGKSCSVMIQGVTLSSSKFTASITSNSYLKRFDGAFVQINNDDRPFTIFHDETMQIEALKGPTDLYQSTLMALAINIQGQIIYIYPYNSGTVIVNGQLVYLGQLNLQSGYKIEKISETEIVLKGPNNFEFKCTLIKGGGLQVGMSVSTSGCNSAKGIFGKCSVSDPSTCSNSDIVCIIGRIGIAEAVKTYNIDKTDIYEYFKSVSKPFKETIFAGIEGTKVTAGTAVRISNGGYVSLPIFDADVFGEISNEISIEIRLKIELSYTGTIMSITNNITTFGITIVNNKYSVQYGVWIYHTNIHVVTGQWTSIGLSLNETSGLLLFHEIHETSYGQYKVIDISDAIKEYGSPILEGSTALLGKWQNITTAVKVSGPGNAEALPVFICDRILIYYNLKTVDDFADLFIQNVYKISSEDLASQISTTVYRLMIQLVIGINFNNGAGFVITDFVHGKVGYIGLTGSVEWVKSDPPLTRYSVPIQNSVDIVPESLSNSNASSFCSNIKESLEKKCSNLSNVLNFFYLSCINDILQTGDANNAIDATIATSDECIRQGQYTEQTVDDLCNSFGKRKYPVFGGENCNQKCIFGNFEAGKCVCEDGYYGAECKSECPGGHSSPCSGHGSCDVVTGKCECDVEWSGDEACSKCQENWSGRNCDLFNSDPKVGEIDIGDDKDHINDSGDLNTTTPAIIDDGKGMNCKVKGKKGKITMFNSKGKKLRKTFDKALLLELKNLRILVSLYLNKGYDDMESLIKL